MSDFRPRSNSEILDAAIEIYRRHFVVFIAINVFTAIPLGISSYFTQSALQLQHTDGLVISAFVRLAGALIAPFVEGAIACAASAAYLGKPVDLEQSVRATFRHPGRLIGAMYRKWFLMGFGFVLFLVPGLIVFKRYFAVPMTVLFEDNTVGGAIRRSRELSVGAGSRIFGLLGGVFVFLLLITGTATQLIAAVWHGAAAIAAGTLVLTAIISPIRGIVATLLYYDVRIRREGYDIELMAQALNAPQPQPLHSTL